MDSMPKVSVVVPVYNVERYLRQCLDSILGQTLRDIEVVCVDDGSTDGSLAILREYAAMDDRVTVIEQRNQFAGVARNAGKAIARGKYLVFWDSDDYFDLTALEKMYDQIEKDEADICVCGNRRFYDNLQVEVPVGDSIMKSRIPGQCPFNRKDNPDYILNFTVVAPWSKMFRKSFVDELGLDFQPVRNGNDIYFVANALCLANRITLVKEHLVTYRRDRTDSLVNTLSSSPYSSLLQWIAVRENLLEHGALPERSFANKALQSIVFCMQRVATWEAFRETYDFVREAGLEKLGVSVQPEGYYYPAWHGIFLEKLVSLSAEDFALWLGNYEFRQLEEVRAERLLLREEKKALGKEVKSLGKRVRALEESRSYRLGRMITKPLRFLRKRL